MLLVLLLLLPPLARAKVARIVPSWRGAPVLLLSSLLLLLLLPPPPVLGVMLPPPPSGDMKALASLLIVLGDADA
jgi:hypothetical protein